MRAPTSSRLAASKARHMRRSVPNWLIRSGCSEPLTFSNRSAGPPDLTVRSLISVISRCGSTSAAMRLSSPSRSRRAIQARRSRGGATARSVYFCQRSGHSIVRRKFPDTLDCGGELGSLDPIVLERSTAPSTPDTSAGLRARALPKLPRTGPRRRLALCRGDPASRPKHSAKLRRSPSVRSYRSALAAELRGSRELAILQRPVGEGPSCDWPSTSLSPNSRASARTCS